jgi:hypothetical protein
LVGVNCISKNKVALKMKLDMVFAEFIDLLDPLRDWIVEKSNKATG